jgi:integrase
VRPLTDEEAAVVRLYAQRATPTRHAATVALLLAGAHTSEAGHLTTSDLNLSADVVQVRGSVRYRARALPLDDWARRVLTERADHLTRHQRTIAEAPVLCAAGGGSRASRQSGLCAVVREILTRAGLASDPDVRPSSLTGYAGRRVFEQTGHVEDAARLLGAASLDTTATLISHHWQHRKPD